MSGHQINERDRRNYEDAEQPASIAHSTDAQPFSSSPPALPGLADTPHENGMSLDSRKPDSPIPGEEMTPAQESSRTLRSSSRNRPLNSAARKVGMRGATKALGRASQQNADLITQLQRRVEEQQAVAQQNTALKGDESHWKAKYEAEVAEVVRLEQENWELQDKMQDALEHIDMLKRALRNSIPIRVQGEPIEAELPFKTYEKEWKSWLSERRQTGEQDKDRTKDLMASRNEEWKGK